MNAPTPPAAVVPNSKLQPSRGGGRARAAAFILAGALLPLGACKPDQPPVKPMATDHSAVQPPTTAPVATAATPVTPEPPVREKIVTVEKQVPVDEVVATIGDQPIRFSQIKAPLMEAYGLKALFVEVQLELARNQVRQRNLTAVTRQDVEDETNLSMAMIAPDAQPSEYPSLIDQLLQKQRLTRVEFDQQMEINANLRKVADSLVEKDVPDAVLRSAFNAMYGETVRVRHIECTNMQQIAEAQQRIAAGVPFEAVARELSLNARTRPSGGELPPFSREYTDLSQAFKDVAFSLKEGEVSDPVQAGGNYHLIKLEKRVPPKAVKFEDVKDHVKDTLRQQAIRASIKQFLQTMGDQARAVIKIQDPVLKAQWEKLLKASEEAAAKAQAEQGQSNRPLAAPAPIAPTPAVPAPATQPK